jgi:N-methylhydantoinase A
MSDIRQTLAHLRDEVIRYLDSLGLEGAPLLTYSLDMRYVSQAFEIPVQLEGSAVDLIDAGTLASQFDRAHHAVFEFDEDGGRAVEVVSFRVGAAVSPGTIPALSANADNPMVDEIDLFYDRAWSRCAKVNRSHLQQLRDRLDGPALVEDGTSTLFVPPGWGARMDDAHNVLLEQTSSRSRDER